MKHTTVKLTLSTRDRARVVWSLYEKTFRDICLGATFVVALLLIHSLLKPAAPPMRPIVQQQQPVIVIQKEPAPTPVPIVPTPAPIVPTPVPIVPASDPIVPAVVPAAPTPEPPAEPAAPPAPPEAPQQGAGGSGKLPAHDMGALTNSSWCQAAAAAGHATCVDQSR